MSRIQDDRDKQILFLKRLQEVKKSASANGNTITEQELEESFEDLQLDDAQMLQVREYLKTNNIGIGAALPVEEVLTDEEKNHLEEYEAMIDAIEIPADNIMDAMEDMIAMNLDVKAAEKTVEEKVNLVADRARELAEELGRKVSVAELAKEYDMDPEEIEEAVRLSGNAIGDIG